MNETDCALAFLASQATEPRWTNPGERDKECRHDPDNKDGSGTQKAYGSDPESGQLIFSGLTGMREKELAKGEWASRLIDDGLQKRLGILSNLNPTRRNGASWLARR
jgi:hypothetical protein